MSIISTNNSILLCSYTSFRLFTFLSLPTFPVLWAYLSVSILLCLSLSRFHCGTIFSHINTSDFFLSYKFMFCGFRKPHISRLWYMQKSTVLPFISPLPRIDSKAPSHPVEMSINIKMILWQKTRDLCAWHKSGRRVQVPTLLQLSHITVNKSNAALPLRRYTAPCLDLEMFKSSWW